MSKQRLDIIVFERGLAESRERAKAMVMSGSVFVDGCKAGKPGMQIAAGAGIEVRAKPEYVSRGGQKLQKALSFFNVSPENKVCADCGASTGGFTDCLLKNGAKLVYAIDVGYGQLAWSIRNDPRVIVMERMNIRHIKAEMFKEKPGLAVVDLSFISLALVLPAVREILTGDGEALCLIKPQFEAGRDSVGKKGVVRDPLTHKAVLDAFMDNAEHAGYCVKGLTYSPIKGPEGNIEFLGYIGCSGQSLCIDTDAVIFESHMELLSKGGRSG